MEANPSCSVCGASDWQALASKTYYRDEHRSDYEARRFEVLFNVWCPGFEAVRIQTVACKNCGFVIFRPRPGKADIDHKYAYLNTAVESREEFTRDLRSDRARSKELLREVRKHCLPASTKVLDFGGGKGRLLHAFLEAGYSCAIVEYRSDVMPGIDYLGDDIDRLATDQRFGLIVCSHVIEHLANPVTVLSALGNRLEKDGVLYVEVPAEIWTCPPPKLDPVTHINFFTRESLFTALQMAGLDVISCRYASFIRPNGKIGLAIKASGRRQRGRTEPVKFGGFSPLKKFLNPSTLDRLLRLARHPRLISNFWK
jgi:SAM-dependent methyltransferase